jgi:TatD DNase family protein
MLDAHHHLHEMAETEALDPLVERARAAGVRGGILAGVEPEGWRLQSALSLRQPGLWPVYGVHPWTVAAAPDAGQAAMDLLEQELRHPQLAPCVGLGETGLDRGPRVEEGSLPAQERALVRQLDLARRYDLPVVLHLVRAPGRALELLRAEGLPASGGMVHSFGGPPDVARGLLDLGLLLSFSGALTWPGSRRLEASARYVPEDRLLVETDAPAQTPEPERSRARAEGRPPRHEPADLPVILQRLAELRGAEAPHLAWVTERNCRRLFRLGAPPP